MSDNKLDHSYFVFLIQNYNHDKDRKKSPNINPSGGINFILSAFFKIKSLITI